MKYRVYYIQSRVCHTLDSLAKKYNVSLEHHHRANQDAEATGYLMFKLLDAFNKKYHENNLNNLNGYAAHGEVYKRARPSHMTVLAKDQAGLKNLYKLVSIAARRTFSVFLVRRSQIWLVCMMVYFMVWLLARRMSLSQ